MGRGKLKYRDVVKRPKSDSRKPMKNTKSCKKLNSFHAYKSSTVGNLQKRKFVSSIKEKYHKCEKKAKTELPVVEQEKSLDISDTSEEELNPIQQLRQEFAKKQKKRLSEAIESDESSLEEEETEEDIIDAEFNSQVELIAETQAVNSKSAEIVERNENVDIDVEAENDDVEDNEDINNEKDNFIRKFTYDLHEEFVESLQCNDNSKITKTAITWPKLGTFTVHIPDFKTVNYSKCLLADNNQRFASKGDLPLRIDYKTVKNDDLSIRSPIANNLQKANPSIAKNESHIFTQLQAELFSIVNNYQDLFYSKRTLENSEELRFMYCLHVVNHVLKARIKVLRHNAKLAKKADKDDENDDLSNEYRDQGVVRPKVLIIQPFRSAAYKTIEMLAEILLSEQKGNIINRKRFIAEYTGDTLQMPLHNRKPDDFEQLFGGNTNDDFRIGVSVTKKCLKLYTDFYASDIIIASPLGLRTVIGAEGEEATRDYDFLAAIELLILDQTDVFLMQNWDHVVHCFNHMHLKPCETHGTDFNRVRSWCLNGWSKYYRQTVVFSATVLPEINAIFNRRCANFWGIARIGCTVECGSIGQIIVQLPHVFRKFHAISVIDSIERRFEFFVETVLPAQKDLLMRQTLIYCANYFDYVRLRNYFKREDVSFVQICEYSKENKVARARDIFYHGDKHFLLYSERFHFFNRIRIKGVRHLVFYHPPNVPDFYQEMCNFMQEGNQNRKIGTNSNMTVTVMYSKYDINQLAAVVGSEKAAKMLNSDQDVHMMVTGID